jgi:hypothetical protein
MRSNSSGGKLRSDVTEDCLPPDNALSMLAIASDEENEVVLIERSEAWKEQKHLPSREEATSAASDGSAKAV